MACNNKCESRQEAIYLLKELGFDVTVLVGTERAGNLALDDAVVVHALKQQLATMCELSYAFVPLAPKQGMLYFVDNKQRDKGESK